MEESISTVLWILVTGFIGMVLLYFTLYLAYDLVTTLRLYNELTYQFENYLKLHNFTVVSLVTLSTNSIDYRRRGNVLYLSLALTYVLLLLTILVIASINALSLFSMLQNEVNRLLTVLHP